MKAAILLLVAIVCIHASVVPLPGARKGLRAKHQELRSQSNANAGYCQGLVCLKDGATCDYYNHPSQLCSSSSYCNNGVCAPSVADGGTCTSSDSCHGDDSWCYAATVGATTGICTPSTYSATIGQTCNVDTPPYAECTSGLSCQYTPSNVTQCVALPTTAGADCSLYGLCDNGFFCNANSSYTCAAYFTLANGIPCDDTTECLIGSYCPNNRGTNVCTAGFASSNSACDSTGHCANPIETCGCPLTNKDGSSGTCTAPIVFTTATAAIVNSLNTCVYAANCATEDCFAACKNQLCDFYHDFYTQFPSAFSCFNAPQDAVATCGVNAGSTSSGCMNHAMLGAVALAAMAAL